MQHVLRNFVVATLMIALPAASTVSGGEPYREHTDPRRAIRLMDNWRYITGDAAGAQNVNCDDGDWTAIQLPHSYNAIDGADGGGYYRGPAWYRTKIDVPTTLKDKQLFLRFAGASLATDVYVDGIQIPSRHLGGFSSFIYDVTDLMSVGSHILAVRVDNSESLEKIMPPQAGDYTKAGGIYRDVSLIAVDRVHVALSELDITNDHSIASSGVYFTATNVSPESAELLVKVKLDNETTTSHVVDVDSYLVNSAGEICWRQTAHSTLVPNQHTVDVDHTGTISNPHLWQGRIDPFLYDLYVELREHDSAKLIDVVHRRVGIRSFEIDPQHGFLLNGRHYDLRGASAHQDELGCGWARSDVAIRRDIDLMLEMGATIVRTSHYPASQVFYDYADKTGLIVYTEVPVNGTSSGGRVPEGTEFFISAREQMVELIRENYNHPSIVVWGLYNELSSSPATISLVNNLQNLTKDEERLLGNLGSEQEPLRKTSAASWSGYGQFESITDTIGLNKYYGWYVPTPAAIGVARDFDQLHAAQPLVPIGVSEYGAGANIHQHEVVGLPDVKLPHQNPSQRQWHSEDLQTWNHEQWWKELASRDYLCYKLIWQMFDSASDGRNEGGQRGINDKGLITADRNVKKDAYFYYKANWNDTERAWANLETLYITDRRWTERTANLAQVKVYSNLGAPTLSLNGSALGSMAAQGFNTYTMTASLATGDNLIEVIAHHAGRVLSDRVDWKYHPYQSDANERSSAFNVQHGGASTSTP